MFSCGEGAGCGDVVGSCFIELQFNMDVDVAGGSVVGPGLEGEGFCYELAGFAFGHGDGSGGAFMEVDLPFGFEVGVAAFLDCGVLWGDGGGHDTIFG